MKGGSFRLRSTGLLLMSVCDKDPVIVAAIRVSARAADTGRPSCPHRAPTLCICRGAQCSARRRLGKTVFGPTIMDWACQQTSEFRGLTCVRAKELEPLPADWNRLLVAHPDRPENGKINRESA